MKETRKPITEEYRKREIHLRDFRDKGSVTIEGYAAAVLDLQCWLILALTPDEKALKFVGL